MAWSVSPVIYAALFVPEAFEHSNGRTILQFGEAKIGLTPQLPILQLNVIPQF